MLQCEPDGRAGIDRDARAADEIVGRELDGRRQRQNRRATAREHTAVDCGSSTGKIRPYSGRGAYSTSRSSVPSTPVTRRSSADGASAPSSWPRSLRPTASASTSTAVPGRGAERRLEHHRLGQVPARDLGLLDRADRPVTGRVRRADARTPRGCRSAGSTASRPSPDSWTSAAEWQSDSRAYSAIGELLMIGRSSLMFARTPSRSFAVEVVAPRHRTGARVPARPTSSI